MSGLLMRWRYFWSRRSRGRTATALLFALLALFGVVYLALPQNGRLLVEDGFSSAVEGIGSLGVGIALGAGAAMCVAVSLALIFVPGYRKHTYLATSPSIIPHVSVYLDAENQLLDAATIRPFMEYLIDHLAGRRADLLYFLDASRAATSAQYKTLYRYGFRPVDVPHNPTGKGSVKEAVDKEMSMHAYERALLGPPNQEFIIVTGDADFVHLVYRLAALGHRVHVWASPIRPAYRTLQTYLDVGVRDLTQIVSEQKVERRETTPGRAKAFRPTHTDEGAASAAEETHDQKNARGTGGAPADSTGQEAEGVARDVLDMSGERAFQRAISGTLTAFETSAKGRRALDRMHSHFRSILGGHLKPQLAQVGYSVGNRIDYWIDHLIAVGIFETSEHDALLRRGPIAVPAAATTMFAMAQAAAQAVTSTAATRENGIVSMDVVARVLIESHDDPMAEETAPLRRFLRASGNKRGAHVRYFVRGARALGLIEFEDVPNSLDTVRFVGRADDASETGI